MSRVGKHPVSLPQGVTAEVKGQAVTVKGKLGTLAFTCPPEVEPSLTENTIVMTPRHATLESRRLWGTARNIVANNVKGVHQGFTRGLEIEGVGFKAAVQGKDLVLNLGFSHEVRYPIPEGVSIKAEKPTVLVISGFEIQRVGQVAAEIRALKPPEPYKGKGIRYAGERVRRKEGKKK